MAEDWVKQSNKAFDYLVDSCGYAKDLNEIPGTLTKEAEGNQVLM